jgi:outer membrane protein assembly factor BamB
MADSSDRVLRALVVGIMAAGSLAAVAADWPCHMADAARSGVSSDTVKFPLSPAWEYEPAQEPEPAWPEPGRELNRMDFDAAFQPVAAGGMVFFGSSADDTVRALTEETGEEKWAFTTGGPVRFAPQVRDGRCFIASDDGCVYALDAATGRMLWRFKAGPRNGRMIGNGRLISSWPCRSGVLADGNAVYATAGMWPSMGVYVFALDASTGNLLWLNDTVDAKFMAQPHHGAYGTAGVPPQGYLLLAGDALLVPAGRGVPAGFDKRTGEMRHCQAGAVVNQHVGGSWSAVAGGLYFQNATRRAPDGPPWVGEYQPNKDDSLAGYLAASGEEVTRVPGAYRILVKGSRAYIARPGRIEALPWAGLRVWSTGTPNGPPSADWSVDHPRVYAMAAAANALFVGGKGSILALDDSGNVVWEGKAGGQVRGLAVANGALIASTREGRIVRFVSGATTSAKAMVSGRRGKASRRPEADGVSARAAGLAAGSGMIKGYAVVLGMQDAAFAEDLAQRTELKCAAFLHDEAKVVAERRRLTDAADGYGTKVTVDFVEADRTSGFPPYIANLVVVGPVSRVPPAEVYRTLRPCGGVLCFHGMTADAARTWAEGAGVPASEIRQAGDSVTVVRGRLAGAYDWDSGATPDKLVKWPLAMLWFGEPGPAPFTSRHLRVGPPVVAAGRAFMRGYHRLIAIDAYNGTRLWTRELPDLYPGSQPGSAQVTADERAVYLTFGREPFDVVTLLASNQLEGVQWPETWQVFGPLPKTIEPLAPAELKAIPAALDIDGVRYAGKPVFSSREWLNLGRHTGRFGASHGAYVMGRIRCQKAGRLVVNASADWWMEWYVDGEAVYSTLLSGNEAPARLATAHTFTVDVSQGEHVVAAFVRSGLAGWTLKSVGGLMLPGSPVGRNSICVKLDASSGEDVCVYGDAQLPPRFDLAVPQDIGFSVGSNQTANVVVRRDGPDLEFRLRADTASATDRHTWELYMDLRPVQRRTGLYSRGAFGFRIATATNGTEGLVQHIAGPSSPEPEVKVVMPAANAVAPAAVPAAAKAPESLLDTLDTAGGELPDLADQPRGGGVVNVSPGAALPRGRSEVMVRFRGADLRGFLRGDLPRSFGFAARLLVGRGPDRTAWQSGGVFGPSKVVTAWWATIVLDPAETPEEELKARREGLADIDQLPAYAWKPQQLPVRPRSWSVTRRHPLTGETVSLRASEAGRAYTRFYGCGGVVCSETTDFFRSATVACYDYGDDSGVRNFSGARPGCGIDMLPALGLLLSPPGSAGCRCGYSFQMSFAMAPATERSNEDWAVFWGEAADVVETASLNLGAPGDRRDPSRRLWLAFPRPMAETVRAGIAIPGSVAGMKPYHLNADRAPAGGTDCPWVYACGLTGEGSVTIGLNQPQPQGMPVALNEVPAAADTAPPAPVRYTVSLHFAEPDAAVKPGGRVFNVSLQGKGVLRNFDIAQDAGGAGKAVVKVFKDVEVTRDLDVSLVPVRGRPPLISAIEVVSETFERVETALALRKTSGDDAAVAALVRMAGERSAALRNRAMRTLAEFAACRRETLAVAGAALSDADVKVRNAGFALLEQAGTNAVPYLMMAASDADAVTRRRAADIAAAMGDAGEAGVRLLSFMARDRDPAIRAQSLRVLTQYGDSRPLEVLAALQKSLADADRVVKDTAQRGFVDLCRGASEIQMSPATVSTILGILKSGPPDLAESIGEALARVGPSVVPALVEMVRAADRSLAGRAVVALGMMGPAAESAVPEMQRQSGLRNDPRFAAAVSNAVIEIRGINAVEAGAPPR